MSAVVAHLPDHRHVRALRSRVPSFVYDRARDDLPGFPAAGPAERAVRHHPVGPEEPLSLVPPLWAERHMLCSFPRRPAVRLDSLRYRLCAAPGSATLHPLWVRVLTLDTSHGALRRFRSPTRQQAFCTKPLLEWMVLLVCGLVSPRGLVVESDLQTTAHGEYTQLDRRRKLRSIAPELLDGPPEEGRT